MPGGVKITPSDFYSMREWKVVRVEQPRPDALSDHMLFCAWEDDFISLMSKMAHHSSVILPMYGGPSLLTVSVMPLEQLVKNYIDPSRVNLHTAARMFKDALKESGWNATAVCAYWAYGILYLELEGFGTL